MPPASVSSLASGTADLWAPSPMNCVFDIITLILAKNREF